MFEESGQNKYLIFSSTTKKKQNNVDKKYWLC